jgi:amino acid transporter
LLVAAFGWGILRSADGKRSLRVAGILMILHGMFGLTWSPMHQREVLAAGGGTFSDTWHIVMSAITVLLMFLSIGFGAAAFGKGFRVYSIITIIIFIVFGVLTFLEAPNVDKNLPTPFIGLWERINIAAFMSWLIVFSIIHLRSEKSHLPGSYVRPITT